LKRFFRRVKMSKQSTKEIEMNTEKHLTDEEYTKSFRLSLFLSACLGGLISLLALVFWYFGAKLSLGLAVSIIILTWLQFYLYKIDDEYRRKLAGQAFVYACYFTAIVWAVCIVIFDYMQITITPLRAFLPIVINQLAMAGFYFYLSLRNGS